MKKTQTIIRADRYYTITGSTGRVIEAVESGENGAGVVLGNYNHAPHQEWSFIRVGEGVYQLKNRGTGKMLDLVSGGSSDGTWLHQWEDAGCSSQMWLVEATNDGYVKLKTQLSYEKCVDVVGMSTALGTQVQIWQDVNGENQTWVIAAVVAKRTRSPKAETTKAAAPKATKAAAPKATKAAATKATKAAATKTTKAVVSKTTKAVVSKTTKEATKTAKVTAPKTTKAAASKTTKAAATKATKA